MKTFYSPQRWWLVSASLGIPASFYLFNMLRYGFDWPRIFLYLAVGTVLIFIGYKATMATLVSKITVTNSVFGYSRRGLRFETPLSNLDKLDRADNGLWKLSFREPVMTSKNTVIHYHEFADFSGWRKTHWKQVLGNDFRISAKR